MSNIEAGRQTISEAEQAELLRKFLKQSDAASEALRSPKRLADPEDWAIDMAAGFVQRDAARLFEMGLFPVLRVQERFDITRPHDRQVIDDCLLAFTPPGRVEHFVDLDGRIVYRASAITVSIYDAEGNGDTDLSRDLLIPVGDEDFVYVARYAMGAMRAHAIRSATEITLPRLYDPKFVFFSETEAA